MIGARVWPSGQADAQAIAVAALQEGMRLVPVKTADQQGLTVLIKTRALFIRQRTKAFNAIRSHLAEFGLIVGTGTVRLEALARSWTAIKQVASLLL
ncbi:hypothetical protein [Rhizobium gallicum]|uniref:hypothetical protein n=1 Tax=Rhizobium gallicum TaxID=56730 RepID=UPI001EF95611|nr:hypothetical protein [Rhizobium gallicum]ULJ74165.1 hypothetical protein L2W42_13130 [Rhizobium gallicum]